MGRTDTVEVQLGECIATQIDEEQQFPIYPLTKNAVCYPDDEN